MSILKISKVERSEVDRLLEQQKENPNLSNRLRYLQQEELNRDGKCCCDVCKSIVDRGKALESYIGGTCIYVSCFECLKAGLSFSARPDGVHVNTKLEGVGVSMIAKEILPSRHRPKGI